MNDKQYVDFLDEQNPAQRLLLDWWEWLQDRKRSGERACLRRSRSPANVLFCPAFFRFRGSLLQQGLKVWDPALAPVAGLAAQVKAHSRDEGFAAQMAQKRQASEKATLSGLRFRRLLQRQTHEYLYLPLLRFMCA